MQLVAASLTGLAAAAMLHAASGEWLYWMTKASLASLTLRRQRNILLKRHPVLFEALKHTNERQMSQQLSFFSGEQGSSAYIQLE